MFRDASAVKREENGEFTFSLDPSWYQGAGSFGGLTAAVVLRAMSTLAGRPARTLHIQFCAPLPAGIHRIETQIERKGTSMSFLSARVLNEGRVCATALGSFGEDRSRDLDFIDLPPLPVPVLEDPERQLMSDPLPSPPFPAFLRHFRMAFSSGNLPYSGAAEAHVGVWVRPRVAEPLDAPLAAALLDAPPPALLAKAAPRRAMSSISITYHFVAPLPDDSLHPEQPMFVDVRGRVANGGYADQEGLLYAPSGRCYAIARQMVAVFG